MHFTAEISLTYQITLQNVCHLGVGLLIIWYAIVAYMYSIWLHMHMYCVEYAYWFELVILISKGLISLYI